MLNKALRRARVYQGIRKFSSIKPEEEKFQDFQEEYKQFQDRVVSSYYKKSQDRFEKELSKFEKKINEGWYSDLRFSSDGCSRGYHSER